ncbi:hypothetical protein OROGR_015658 [Orobanche gracilis]
MSFSLFAAANPPLKPSSLIGGESLIDSEKLMDLCAKTLEEADFTVLATKSLISAIDEALDAPLFGSFQVFEAMDIDMIEGFVPDSEEEEGGAAAGGGESDFWTAEATPVTAEAVSRKRSRSPSSDMEEMIGLLIPAYLSLSQILEIVRFEEPNLRTAARFLPLAKLPFLLPTRRN